MLGPWLAIVALAAPSVDGARLEADLLALVKDGSRVEGTPGVEAARAVISARLSALGLVVEEDVFQLHHPFAGRPVRVANLRVTIGPEVGSPLVLIAHLDSRGADDVAHAKRTGWAWDRDPAPGADDNASGCAALLELARLLVESPPGGRVDLIFSGGEELAEMGKSGFLENLGAERAADRYLLMGQKIRGVISVDMVLVPRPWGEAFRIYEDLASSELAMAIEWAVWAEAPSATIERRLDPAFTWSDHGAFWAIGAPAVLFIEDDFHHPRYHRPSDVVSAGSIAQLVTATKILYGAVRILD